MHYKNLLEYTSAKKNDIFTKKISELLVSMEFLEKKVNDKNFIKKYIKVINENIDKFKNGWWSEILPLKTWVKYE